MKFGRETEEDLLIRGVEAVIAQEPGSEFRGELYRLWQLVRDHVRNLQRVAATDAARKGNRTKFEPIRWMGAAGFPAFREALTAGIPRLAWKLITVDITDQAETAYVHARRNPAAGAGEG